MHRTHNVSTIQEALSIKYIWDINQLCSSFFHPINSNPWMPLVTPVNAFISVTSFPVASATKGILKCAPVAPPFTYTIGSNSVLFFLVYFTVGIVYP